MSKSSRARREPRKGFVAWSEAERLSLGPGSEASFLGLLVLSGLLSVGSLVLWGWERDRDRVREPLRELQEEPE